MYTVFTIGELQIDIGLVCTKNPPTRVYQTGWEWIDGQPYNASLDLWGPGQPTGRTDEKCVYLTDTKMWYDTPCDNKHRYICKRGK